MEDSTFDALARAAYLAGRGSGAQDWIDLPSAGRTYWRQIARAVFAAVVAPDAQVMTAIAVLRAYVAGTLQTGLCDELDEAIIQAWNAWLLDHPDDDEPDDYETPLTQSW